MNSLFNKYGKKHEHLIYDICVFFSSDEESMFKDQLVEKGVKEHLNYKSVQDFVVINTDKYRNTEGKPIQPSDVNQICEKLVLHNKLTKVNFNFLRNMDGMMNFYICRFDSHDDNTKKLLTIELNSIVYGFEYIYERAKKLVYLLKVKESEEDEPRIGTCFLSVLGYITAKHCIENYKYISINNMPFKKISDVKIKYFENVDLAIIIDKTPPYYEGFIFDEPKVLSEVIALGYPNIPGFDNFLNGTSGTITAIERSYLTKSKLILITNPVKGGNSGGPLINIFGRVVGVITDKPDYEGEEIKYDNFGYGCATPVNYIYEDEY